MYILIWELALNQSRREEHPKNKSPRRNRETGLTLELELHRNIKNKKITASPKPKPKYNISPVGSLKWREQNPKLFLFNHNPDKK